MTAWPAPPLATLTPHLENARAYLTPPVETLTWGHLGVLARPHTPVAGREGRAGVGGPGGTRPPGTGEFEKNLVSEEREDENLRKMDGRYGKPF